MEKRNYVKDGEFIAKKTKLHSADVTKLMQMEDNLDKWYMILEWYVYCNLGFPQRLFYYFMKNKNYDDKTELFELYSGLQNGCVKKEE